MYPATQPVDEQVLDSDHDDPQAVALVVLGLGLFLALRGERRPGILLIGIDGADWDVLDPLIEKGRLPNLAQLKREGVSGPLMTLRDIPLSPVIWTSIATGKGPDQHGITWFLVDTPDGQRIPVRSYNRKVQALWNILAEHERRPAFVGWWATAPAEDVGEGVIASDALGFHGFGRTGQGLPDEEKVHPSELYAELSVLVPPVQQIDYSYGKRFFHLSADEYYRAAFSPSRASRLDPNNPIHLFQEYTATTLGYTAIARRLLEARELDLLGVYYESSDSMSHLFMKYAPPRQEWIEPAEYERFKDVVDEYYVIIDEQVGALLADVPADWGVIVVSDHGFRIGASRPKSVATVDMQGAHLDHEPEGIFVARGPHFRRGASLEGASVLDVTPTLLHALDLPVARDMAGRVLADLFAEGELEARPIRYVESYESAAATARRGALSKTESGFEADEAMAALTALGYAGDEAVGGKPGAETESMSSPEVHNNLGRIHLSKGELDAAVAEFEKALRLSPDNPEALTNIGVVRLAQGRKDLALRAFTQALQSNPNNVGALVQIAEIKKSQNDLAGAEAFYRQALAIDARLPDPYLGLGDALLRQGKVQEAKKIFVQAIELDPLLAIAHYDLGVAHEELGEHAKAKTAYEKALALAPEHPETLNNLGDYALKEGRIDDALGHFQRAAKVSPFHMQSRFNVGAVLLLKRDFEGAVRWLEEAAALEPDQEVVQDRLAQAYWQKGELVEARRRYEMQVRVFPASPNPCVQLARLSKLEKKDEETLAWIRNAVQRGGPPVAQALRQDALFLGLDFEKILGLSGEPGGKTER